MIRQPLLAGAAIFAGALFVISLLFLLRRRVTLEERERRRRLYVNVRGRITDAVITDVHTVQASSGATAHLLHYSYDLHGVSYSAAQDITALLAHIPGDPRRIAGPASVKYLPRNPSNSIVICEQWSGLR